MKVAVIIPCHNKFSYTLRAIETLNETETDDEIITILIDNNSPDFNEEILEQFRAVLKQPCVFHRFDNDGSNLTRSWNFGIALAKEAKCDYCVLANDDILFSKSWWNAMRDSLEHYDLVGPITNAPGAEHYSSQNLATYLPNYECSPDNYNLKIEFCPKETPGISGFFMAAKTQTWVENAISGKHIFNSSPNYKLVGSEDEFQQRFKGRIGVAPSYIFHYRSTSRTDLVCPAYLKGLHRKEKIVVYTAIVNNYDFVPEYSYDGVDFKCIELNTDGDSTRLARKHKVLAHQYMEGYDYSIWLDGNMRLLQHPAIVIQSILRDADLASICHPTRCCTYQEAMAVKKLGLDDPAVVDAQMNRYKGILPVGNGLVETAIVIRKHNDKVKAFNELWWSEIENGSKRDQLSVMWALYHANLKLTIFGNGRRNNPVAYMIPHKKARVKIRWGK